MGIETALIGGAVLGGGMNMIGSRNAARAQSRGMVEGARQAQEAANAGYEDAVKYLAPYTQFGEQMLPHLSKFIEQKPFSYGDFYNSQQFADLSAAENERVARQAQAGVGVRSGQGQQALAAIAPQLAMQERAYQEALRQQQFNNIFNMSQFGGGFANAGANAAINRGNTSANYMYGSTTGAANARAQGQQSAFGGLGNIIGDIGTIYAAGQMGYLTPKTGG